MYVERIKREYGVECEVGAPRVNYRESIQKKTKFDYQHKKQSGGQGQYGRVMGFIEPAESVMAAPEFENRMIGTVRTQPPPTPTPEPKTSLNRTSQRRADQRHAVPRQVISPSWMAAIEKGFKEQALEGPLTEHPMCGVRFVLEDGASHQVRNFPSI